MSRSTTAMAVLALACVAAPATVAAQQLPRARFGVGVGLTAPRNEFHADQFGDGFNTGWQGMILLEFRESRRPIGVRVDLVFGENAGNDQLNADVSAVAGASVTTKLRMSGGNVDVVYGLGRSKRGGAYVMAGGGVYRSTLAATSGGVTGDSSETKFAWNAGAGLTYPVGRASMFLELRYTSVSSTFFASKKMPFAALTAGFRFGPG